MQQVALLVRLKIPDVTALTARNALKRRMGYDRALSDLRREDYYEFEIDAETPDAARELVGRLAEETNFFVNPNKHAFSLLSPGDAPPTGDGTHVLRYLVTDVGDKWGEGMAATLRARGGEAERVEGLSRGVLWTMELDADSPDDARRVAEEIAITRRIDEGLLLNPHYQEGRII